MSRQTAVVVTDAFQARAAPPDRALSSALAALSVASARCCAPAESFRVIAAGPLDEMKPREELAWRFLMRAAGASSVVNISADGSSTPPSAVEIVSRVSAACRKEADVGSGNPPEAGERGEIGRRTAHPTPHRAGDDLLSWEYFDPQTVVHLGQGCVVPSQGALVRAVRDAAGSRECAVNTRMWNGDRAPGALITNIAAPGDVAHAASRSPASIDGGDWLIPPPPPPPHARGRDGLSPAQLTWLSESASLARGVRRCLSRTRSSIVSSLRKLKERAADAGGAVHSSLDSTAPQATACDDARAWLSAAIAAYALGEPGGECGEERRSVWAEHSRTALADALRRAIARIDRAREKTSTSGAPPGGGASLRVLVMGCLLPREVGALDDAATDATARAISVSFDRRFIPEGRGDPTEAVEELGASLLRGEVATVASGGEGGCGGRFDLVLVTSEKVRPSCVRALLDGDRRRHVEVVVSTPSPLCGGSSGPSVSEALPVPACWAKLGAAALSLCSVSNSPVRGSVRAWTRPPPLPARPGRCPGRRRAGGMAIVDLNGVLCCRVHDGDGGREALFLPPAGCRVDRSRFWPRRFATGFLSACASRFERVCVWSSMAQRTAFSVCRLLFPTLAFSTVGEWEDARTIAVLGREQARVDHENPEWRMGRNVAVVKPVHTAAKLLFADRRVRLPAFCVDDSMSKMRVNAAEATLVRVRPLVAAQLACPRRWCADVQLSVAASAIGSRLASDDASSAAVLDFAQ